uniref:Uncharacterized protein n=1 Tax=Salix viminalis TaxID=40686 RepID=A0A6N2KFY9_SALVM
MDCLVYTAKPWKQGGKKRENLTGRPRIPPKFAKHLEKNRTPSCVGKQNEVDQPVGKDQKHGSNIETIDIESDSKIEPDISMIKLYDQQQPQCQKNIPQRTNIVKPELYKFRIQQTTWMIDHI